LVRVAAGREPSPSEAAVDSQSVETATMISIDVGYGACKQIHGRKRHLSVDLLGLVLRVLVTSADVPEREGAKKVFKRVHRMGDKVNRLHTIWMDGGYRGENFMRWLMDMFRWIVEMVLRHEREKGFRPFTKALGSRKNVRLAQLVSARVHLSFANTSTGELTIKISTPKRKNRGNTLNIPLRSR
jgi:transposase